LTNPEGQSGLSRFQLLLGLTGLAFATITAGVGLMQAYYAAYGVLATNGTSITNPPPPRFLIAKQLNILFPLGQFLLIVGLAIIFSILAQSIFYLKPWAKQAGWKWIAVVIAGSAVCVAWSSLRFSTYASLSADFALHYHTLPIFLLVSLWFTVALYVDGKTRR
jgi:hypothetical protein